MAAHPVATHAAPAEKPQAAKEPAPSPTATVTPALTAAPEPPQPTPPAPQPEPAPAAPILDGQKIWRDLIAQIRSARPLITSYLLLGRVLSSEGGTLRVGFAPSQKMAFESLQKATQRKFLEGLLAKLAGVPVDLRLELQDREEELPPAAEIPAAAANGSNGNPGSAGNHAPPSAHGAAEDPVESFKNDPLIQKALKIFEGEIRSVEGPATPSGVQV
jgi:DNA polymerase-3 subunit gamma/tau